MKLFVQFHLFCLLTLSVIGKPISSTYTVFEVLDTLPRGYTKLSDHVPQNSRIKLSIHLPQQNVNSFEQHLYDISTPDHPNYGRHLSQEAIQYILAPSTHNIKAVTSWLKSFDFVPAILVEHDTITLDITIAQAQIMLQTTYSYYRDDFSSTDRRILRTTQYSLPKELHSHIDFIQPTTMFGFRSQASLLEGARLSDPSTFPPIVHDLDPSCNLTITPSCLSYLYNFAGYIPDDNSVIGIGGFLGQIAQEADLQTFLKTFAPKDVGEMVELVSINGGLTTQFPAGSNETVLENETEANLDIEYTVSITSPIKNVFYSVGGSPPFLPDGFVTTNTNEPYLDFLNYILQQETVPQTLTISYGDDEQTVPKSYALKVFSSGDVGPGSICVSNTDGKPKFIPTFPASCPFVTSVGGTEFIEPESAVYFSAGGFSDYFARPHYQDTQISHYFRQHSDTWKPFEQYFNKNGRGFPDVSAQAYNFSVIYNGTQYFNGGTSAAAPTFASIIALVNSELIKCGKPPLGFLNPWLYSRKIHRHKGLTDITSGGSMGCNDTYFMEPLPGNFTVIPGAGWKAVEGWDASSGLGTPNFRGMLESLNIAISA